MSDSPRVVDSLDEFPPESLDLYSSTPGQGLDDNANLIAIVPASLVNDAAASSAAPSRTWHRRRRRWFGGALATGIFRRRDRARRPAQQLRPEGAKPRKVAESARGTTRAVDRQQRRARIRRTITGAPSEGHAARLATVTRLTPALARVVATSSASVLRRLRPAMHSAVTHGHAVSLRVHGIAMSLAYFIGRAIGTSVAAARAFTAVAAPALATVRARVARHIGDAINSIPSADSVVVSARRVRQHTVAAVRLASRLLHAQLVTAAASRTRFTRYLREAVNSVMNARAVPVRVRRVSPHAVAAVRLAGRMLHPRSVAVAGAMLALIAIAGPVNIIDTSAGRTVPPAKPAAVPPAKPAAAAPAANEPAVSAPKMVDLPTPTEERSPTAQAPVATASVPTTTPPVVPRDQRLARPDVRGIQTVLNRYRDAVSTQDVSALRSIWPGADAEALQRDFAGVREQNVEFEGCRISSAGTGALASCAGVLESGFKPGDRRPRVERRRWQFTLRRAGEGWRIVEVHTQRG